MRTVPTRASRLHCLRPRTLWFAIVATLLAMVLAVPVPAQSRATDLLGDAPVSTLPPETARLAPDVAMPSGILVTSDGRVLWAREPDSERAMASTTKIMTAVVALEQGDPSDTVIVSERAARIGQAAARLRAGTGYPMRTLLEALLVRSGNDASIAVAEHVGGSVEAYVEMMNAKATELGMDRTSFENPHGLDAPGHYTTAADLATLARYAMADPEFRRMVRLERVVIEDTDGPGELENSNLLINTLEGATGVKTGWTSRAGYCLVASAKRHDLELFAVVLGTDNEMERFQQAGLLLEWGFVHYTSERLAASGERVGVVQVADYLDVELGVVVAEPVSVRVFGPAGPVERSASLPGAVDAPVTAGDRIGTLSFVQGERLIAQAPLVAAESVRRPTWPERAWIALVRAWRSAFGGGPAAEPSM